MRTTLDIDDDLLMAAKELARREGSSAGAVISRLLRASLTGGEGSAAARGMAAKPVAGFAPFAARPGVVTSLEQVNALREAEGI
ncbi:CopG family transcriptional regulator [Paucibacter sp. PLA-PC-4]|uniref:ribbon-helix-helix domain-containing protein n=1 Tax=Paucibacter sp. PLA-PC-4 TaxID=2993655 RepID=UPI00224B16E8|nr:CopG family transcriptional regulator [Paucibacter sp. PLA-PC-4]